jgi:hypothetical protein
MKGQVVPKNRYFDLVCVVVIYSALYILIHLILYLHSHADPTLQMLSVIHVGV